MNNLIKRYLKVIIPVKFQSRLREIFGRIFYFGFRFKCPFCKANLRAFLMFGYSFPVLKEKKVVGSGYRPTQCPVCRSFDRERLIYLYLVHKTDIFVKQQKLLHVAPERMIVSILQKNASLDYLNADLNPDNAMIRMDITNIEYSDNYFDAIICNHVLEHVIDDRKAMSELYRTLKPGGWAILQVPLSLLLEKTYEDFSITSTTGREKAVSVTSFL